MHMHVHTHVLTLLSCAMLKKQGGEGYQLAYSSKLSLVRLVQTDFSRSLILAAILDLPAVMLFSYKRKTITSWYCFFFRKPMC